MDSIHEIWKLHSILEKHREGKEEETVLAEEFHEADRDFYWVTSSAEEDAAYYALAEKLMDKQEEVRQLEQDLLALVSRLWEEGRVVILKTKKEIEGLLHNEHHRCPKCQGNSFFLKESFEKKGLYVEERWYCRMCSTRYNWIADYENKGWRLEITDEEVI